MSGQPGFRDFGDLLKGLSAQGDPLEKLAATVDFEMFRPALERATARRDPSKGERPGFEPALKFRILVLRALHGLSLEQTEYLPRDRLSWMRFCGLGSGNAVLVANTLWDFREALIAAKALDALFARLDRTISEAGYFPRGGQIVEATLVAAPRQRNTEAQKARIEVGERPPTSGLKTRRRLRRRTPTRAGAPSIPKRSRRRTGRSSSTSRSRPSATSRPSASTAPTGSSAAA